MHASSSLRNSGVVVNEVASQELDRIEELISKVN
jgi:hypothetical protein